MRKFCLNGVIILLAVMSGYGQDVVRYVNPFIGTANSGNTNPGAVMPWGMASISPFNTYDTITGKAEASPYYYGNKYIYGFTHVNMSGLGCADLGIACLMPVSGPLNINQLHRSEYSGEQAGPGYYSVNLDRYHIKTELTATLRSAISAYTFPAGQSHILLNMGMGLTAQKGACIRLVSDTEVEGFKMIGNICGLKTIQTVYFVMKLSKQPLDAGVCHEGKVYTRFRGETAGKDIGAFFSFNTGAGEKIFIKTGISYVSIENARKNLQTEQEGFDFEQTRAAARQAWEQALSVIRVEGGTPGDRVKFYTALYHACLHPNIFNDANGEYHLFESDRKGMSKEAERYTVFSLWDTYRSLHPLLSLLYPRRQSAMVKSLLGMAEESGWLPRWEYAGIESGAMTGDPALAVIADTWMRGIRDFDIDRAYAAMKHNATAPEKDNYMRPGMDNWLRYGFIPEDAPNVLHPFDHSTGSDYENMRERRIVWGCVSTPLEYCIADWNLGELAKYLGKTNDYLEFHNRSLLYKKSFDTVTGFMRPRLHNGRWAEPFDPATQKNNAFTEGSSWNYTFMVPHDIPGLIKLMGGPTAFREKLDTCFDQQHFDITNEPDLAYPYLYNYLSGEEWRTHKRLRKLLADNFNNSPGGLPGNDDCGELSSWLLFTMMGFYPDCPGNPEYQLTIPVFNKISILLDPDYYPGKSIVIESDHKPGTNYRIRSITWNAKKHSGYRISHQDLVKGGKLSITTRQE